MAIRGDVYIKNADSSPRIIEVAAPSTEILMQDLVDTIRSIEDDLKYMDDIFFISASGKESLGAAGKAGIIVTLNNALLQFEARPGPDWVQCLVQGGSLVAVDYKGNYFDTPIQNQPFVNVTIFQDRSGTISSVNITALQYIVEALRPSHSGFGNVYFWDPVDGSDTNTGLGPHTAFKTFAKAHATVTDGGNDIIFALSTNPAGPATTTERVQITKSGVRLRGPGRGSFTVAPIAGATPAISITGRDAEISGISVAPTVAMMGVSIEADDFLLADVECRDIDGHAFNILNATRGVLRDCRVLNATSHGFHVETSDNVTMRGCHTDDAQVGLHCAAGAYNVHVLDSCVFLSSTTDGIQIDATAQDIVISRSTVIAHSGGNPIIDLGTETVYEAVQEWELVGRISISSGTTASVLKTTATAADDFFTEGCRVSVRDGAGLVAVREVQSYAQTEGTFTLVSPLPFVPPVGSVVGIIGGLGFRDTDRKKTNLIPALL